VLTLIGAPIIGKLADKHGKLAMYRVIAPISALLLVVITHLDQVVAGLIDEHSMAAAKPLFDIKFSWPMDFAIHAPSAAAAVSIAIVGLLMLTNAGRMIAAMAMITSSVLPERRGGFMSANASVQHIASGLGAYVGGLIITQASPEAPLGRYGYVGWLGAGATVVTLWLAGRVRIVDDRQGHAAEAISLAAAAEATADVGEPFIGA
jgi:MFS family permease